MIAKEADASDSVRQPASLFRLQWETYKGKTGRVLAMQSELGEPIHKIRYHVVERVRRDRF
jgi:enoyl reductase-like protein